MLLARSLVRRAPANYRISPSSVLRQKKNFNLTRTNPLLKSPVRNLTSSSSAIAAQNVDFLEGAFSEWKQNPSAVDPSLSSLFEALERVPASGATGVEVNQGDATFAIDNSLKLMNFIRAYQVRGHLLSKLDPLGLEEKPVPPETNIEHYGWSEADLDRPIYLGELGNLKSGFWKAGKVRTLRDVRDHLRKVYCGTIGLEYMHIQDRGRCDWIRERFESLETAYPLSREDKIRLLDRLVWADSLEKFLQKKYTSVKRFGLDGCEVLVPGLKTLIDEGSELGVNNVVIGMPHRGRLNVLCNVLRMPLAAIFRNFNPGLPEVDNGFSGDVKYHLGTSYDRQSITGKKVHLSLLANPSHLEAVDPVVMGKAKARQVFLGDTKEAKKAVLPLLLHGDAAFSGQGVVYECFDMTNLPNYGAGGNVHVIVNNQIGFTTDPKAGRSWFYPTEVAKTIEAPIFHVNSDDPEAVIRSFKMAAEWRQTFNSSVVIDLVCYRRYGHNEVDQPSFTQPLMYAKIAKQPHTVELYSKKLIAEGTLTPAEYKQIQDKVNQLLNEGFEAAAKYKEKFEWLSSKWAGFKSRAQLSTIRDTGIQNETLRTVGESVTKIPEGFNIHPTLKKIIEQRRQMAVTGEHVDWAFAEHLAFGSLLLEGNHVRLSGQDVERGTFSHRHAVWNDQKTGAKYLPLSNLTKNQANIVISNSSLSEYGVLGFEYGYSLEAPNQLVLWEAQFGDFVNGAQIIIDQFISSCEAKWKHQCGLVLLLPHGYEGQGPEHSSAKLERFLQLHDSNPFYIPPMGENTKQIQESNFQVVNITTPANYFHALRRQVHREFRKPLVVMSPKSLLKHRLAVSSLKEFETGNRFKRVIPEVNTDMVPDHQVKRVVFCSGKVYYDFYEAREKRNAKNVAFVRLEQIAPFPFDLVMEQLKRYPNAEVAWGQEEPMNMGAFNYVYHHFRTSMVELDKHQPSAAGTRPFLRDIRYIGRDASASPSTGFHSIHLMELNKFLDEALN